MQTLLRLATIVPLILSAPALMALPDFGNKMKSVSSKQAAPEGAELDATEELSAADAQEAIIVEFREIVRDVTVAQEAIVKALGLKDDADAAEADAAARAAA